METTLAIKRRLNSSSDRKEDQEIFDVIVFKGLRTLDMDGKLDKKNIKTLALFLDKNQVDSLSLCSNNLDDKDIEYLAPSLNKSNIKILLLNDNKISNTESLVPLAGNLKRLSLRSNALFILKSLDKFQKLEFLDLYKNHIDDKAVMFLVDMVKKNMNLTWLNLGENSLGNEAFQKLTSVLSNPFSSLKTLILRSNHIGDTQFNRITKENFTCFRSLLENNTTLELIDCGDNYLGSNEKEVKKALEPSFIVNNDNKVRLEKALKEALKTLEENLPKDICSIVRSYVTSNITSQETFARPLLFTNSYQMLRPYRTKTKQSSWQARLMEMP